MGINHHDQSNYWLPKGEDRQKLEGFLVRIKEVGNADSDASLAVQNELLKFYYPVLRKIAEHHFEKYVHPDNQGFLSAEDTISVSFKAAIERILVGNREANITKFNQGFMLSVIARCRTRQGCVPSAEGFHELGIEGDSGLSEVHHEMRDFWQMFLGMVKERGWEFRSARGERRAGEFCTGRRHPYSLDYMDHVDFRIVKGVIEDGRSFVSIASDCGLKDNAIGVRYRQIIGGMKRLLAKNEGEFPLLNEIAWGDRVREEGIEQKSVWAER